MQLFEDTKSLEKAVLRPDLETNIALNARFFYPASGLSDEEKKDIEETESRELLSRIQRGKLKFNHQDQLLYLVSHEKAQILSWSLETLMSVARTLDEEGSLPPTASQLLRVPFSVSSLDVFEDNESLQESESAKKESALQLSRIRRTKHSLIPYTEIVMQNYFNENLFNFFYANEEVTCTLVFNSADISSFLSPAQVNGTNYGRILISPFF